MANFLGSSFGRINIYDSPEYDIKKERKKKALENLKDISRIKPGSLERDLEKKEKYWNRQTKISKNKRCSALFKIVHASSSWKYVPEIQMLKSVIKLKGKLDKTNDNKEKNKLIKNYVSNIKEDYLLRELSILDRYYSQ